jgi:hypothetical protein
MMVYDYLWFMDSLQWKTLLKWMILENPYPVETFLWSHDPALRTTEIFRLPTSQEARPTGAAAAELT